MHLRPSGCQHSPQSSPWTSHWEWSGQTPRGTPWSWRMRHCAKYYRSVRSVRIASAGSWTSSSAGLFSSRTPRSRSHRSLTQAAPGQSWRTPYSREGRSALFGSRTLGAAVSFCARKYFPGLWMSRHMDRMFQTSWSVPLSDRWRRDALESFRGTHRNII